MSWATMLGEVPQSTPYLQRFVAMDMDERWVNRSPETMLDTFHWYRGEGFGLIVEDLLALPADRGVVAEGCSPSTGTPSGFFPRPSSAGPRSRVGAGCGRSPAVRTPRRSRRLELIDTRRYYH